jgi:hypothetical protein
MPMPFNEAGVKLDRNGYAPSILDTDAGLCYVCWRHTETARHEIFFGRGRRKKSKRLGLWVNLCPRCHTAVHNNGKYKSLKQNAQEAIEKIGRPGSNVDIEATQAALAAQGKALASGIKKPVCLIPQSLKETPDFKKQLDRIIAKKANTPQPKADMETEQRLIKKMNGIIIPE